MKTLAGLGRNQRTSSTNWKFSGSGVSQIIDAERHRFWRRDTLLLELLELLDHDQCLSSLLIQEVRERLVLDMTLECDRFCQFWVLSH